jgi:xanthine dehydrogenase accessory factor
VLDELMSTWRAGGTAGVATVVRTIRSAPRQPGAAMVVAPDGSVAGSVSGGCVEAAVYELAKEVVATGRPRLQRYGITDDDAFAIGLTCGGIIDVFAEPVSATTFPRLDALADDVAAYRPTAVATVAGGWSSASPPATAHSELLGPTPPSSTMRGVCC